MALREKIEILPPELPLSEEEENSWKRLVAEGDELMRPYREVREAKRIAQRKSPKSPKTVSMKEVPTRVKRWVVARAAGISFKKSFEVSGTSWLEVMDAKARSEDFRNANCAMEERSRQLMRAMAHSIVEQSQEEGAHVSMAQTQVSMKILSSLDRPHFGEDGGRRPDAGEEVAKAIGNGGFVINLIADAAKACEKAPEAKPHKALVYADV